MIISKRFTTMVNAHLMGNILQIEKYPLIMAIVGRPGMGKTWQLRSHLEKLGVDVISINAADLESDRAGAPAKLLKEKYLKAAINMKRNKLSAIVIDDIDTTVGEWERNTGTVNHQGILAFLMHIADNPCYIEDIGDVYRVPVFLTGNNFDLIYEPLRRPGRTFKFEWEPNRDEKIAIIKSIFSLTDQNVANGIIDMYPDKPISFFSDLYVTQNMDMLSSFIDKVDFNKILTDRKYIKQLQYQYIHAREQTNWKKWLDNMIGGCDNGEN